MKRGWIAALALLGFLGAASQALGQEQSTESPQATAPEPAFRMTTYYLALLRRGPNWTPEATPEVAQLQEQHMANIRKMGESGKLIVAGPFLEQKGPGALAGLFIFKVGSLDEAKELAGSDPAVKAGRLAVEVIPWLGPEDLMKK